MGSKILFPSWVTYFNFGFLFFFFLNKLKLVHELLNQCILLSHWVNIMIKILLISLEMYTKHYIKNKIIVEINYIILCMCISFWEKNIWKSPTIHPMIGYGQEWWSSRLLFITCYLSIWKKWCEKNCGSKLIYIYIYNLIVITGMIWIMNIQLKTPKNTNQLSYKSLTFLPHRPIMKAYLVIFLTHANMHATICF